VFDTSRSFTSHTAKYNVSTFIEKIALAKSYRTQLNRSTAGSRERLVVDTGQRCRGSRAGFVMAGVDGSAT
jgi:hypothetical protein